MKRIQRKPLYAIGQEVYFRACPAWEIDDDMEYFKGEIIDIDAAELTVNYSIKLGDGDVINLLEGELFDNFADLYAAVKIELEQEVQAATEQVDDCKQELADAKDNLKQQNRRLAHWLRYDPRCK